MVYNVQQWYAVEVSDTTMLPIAENVWAKAKGFLPKIKNLTPASLPQKKRDRQERSHTLKL
jgi:hypothetical protein